MSKPLDEQYLEWLYSQVASTRLKNPARTYWSLLEKLFTKEFIWLIPNDDNRVEDGRDLRYEFINEVLEVDRNEVDQDWLSLGCSVLEMLVGLSRRLAFQDEGQPRDWFWHMLDNLDLRKYSDANFNPDVEDDIDDVLDTIVWRTYHFDGRGGLFPLREAAQDQREIELWYQASAYLIERD